MDLIRVGLIDDEPQTLKMFHWEFGDRFDVHTFISGEEALDALDKGLEFDVIISDQRMPKMAGDSVLIEIRRRCEHTQLLITTAYADVEPLRRCVNDAGVIGYIEKPWKPETVVEMVEHARANQLRKKAEDEKTQELVNVWREAFIESRMKDVRLVCETLAIPAHIAEKYRDVVTKIAIEYEAHWTDVGLLPIDEDDRLSLDFLRAAVKIRAESDKPTRHKHNPKIPLALSWELITRCKGEKGPSFDVTREKGCMTLNADAGGCFGDSYLDPLSARDSETLFRNALLLLALDEIEKSCGSLSIDQRNGRLMGSITFQV